MNGPAHPSPGSATSRQSTRLHSGLCWTGLLSHGSTHLDVRPNPYRVLLSLPVVLAPDAHPRPPFITLPCGVCIREARLPRWRTSAWLRRAAGDSRDLVVVGPAHKLPPHPDESLTRSSRLVRWSIHPVPSWVKRERHLSPPPPNSFRAVAWLQGWLAGLRSRS